jgi:AcrR family transcriptional regulator
MPKLWDESIEAHRAAVREATIAATATLVAQHGVSAVTMSQIASETGIGRATLYKYFPDVESILLAWHEQHVGEHVRQLGAARDAARGDALNRLRAVLTAYAHMSRPHDGSERVAMLHRGEHVSKAERDLTELVTELIGEAVAAGIVRKDVPPEELALYCLHAANAAPSLRSRAAVSRLLDVMIAGLTPEGRVSAL